MGWLSVCVCIFCSSIYNGEHIHPYIAAKFTMTSCRFLFATKIKSMVRKSEMVHCKFTTDPGDYGNGNRQCEGSRLLRYLHI